MAGQINCPAPLLEDPTDTRLAELLVPAPYVVPEKKATGTQKSSRRPVVSDSSSNDSEAHSSHEDEEEEKEVSSPPPRQWEKRKGRPPQLGRPEGPRREGPFLRTTP